MCRPPATHSDTANDCITVPAVGRIISGQSGLMMPSSSDYTSPHASYLYTAMRGTVESKLIYKAAAAD